MAILAALHAYFVLQMICCSLFAKELAFDVPNKASKLLLMTKRRMSVVRARTNRLMPTKPVTLQSAQKARIVAAFDHFSECMVTGSRALRFVLRRITSVVSVESPHFELVFLVREGLQTALQTYQTYWMSRLIPREWLNRFFVVCVVLNCWTTPLIKALGTRLSVPTERLLCLVSDMTLDFVSTVVVPIVLFIPYYQAYDPVINDFPNTCWYSTPWIVNTVFELQILLIQSWTDALGRVFFALNMMNCLEIIKSLLQRTQQVRRIRIRPEKGKAAPADTDEDTRVTSKASCSHIFAHGVFICWGIFVAVAHIQATTQPQPDLCVTQVHPWLSNRPACSIFELNCARVGIKGTALDFDQYLDDVDETGLACLQIHHCAGLEMSPKLQTFNRLLALVIDNSTIVRWDSDAEINNDKHPNLRLFSVVRVNMTELPRGVQSSNMPNQLRDIEISHTNLTDLPEDLDLSWSNIYFLYFEWSPLTSFPMSLLRMPLWDLSLVGSRFDVLPRALFETETISSLHLNAIPVSTLPADVQMPLDCPLTMISLDSSNLSALPPWLNETYFDKGGVVFAGSTPLCLSVQENASASSAGPSVTPVICEPLGAEDISYIPVELIADTNLPPISRN